MPLLEPTSGVLCASAGIHPCRPDWNWSPPAFTDLDLWYVFGGAGTIATNEQTVPVQAGDCLLFHPGISVQGTTDPHNPLQVIAIHFQPLDHSGLVCRPQAWPPLHRRMENIAFLRHLMTRCVMAFTTGDVRGANAWLQAALLEVFRQDARTYPPGPDGEQARRIDSICEEVLMHPERRHRLPELAERLHVTPGHFARLFRKHRRESVRDFILRARIEAAQNLLLGSSHTVTQIAEMLGYGNIYFFSKQFKEKTGLTPSRFRTGTANGERTEKGTRDEEHQ
ncbi:MAG: helix-turn-helix domain-containing protein [Kiritimatiellae bacterium]|nr:helix-turn-helix domain-containing protein [Kiritimatiellia bacterium]